MAVLEGVASLEILKEDEFSEEDWTFRKREEKMKMQSGRKKKKVIFQ